LEDRTLLDATLQAITLASVAPPSVAAAAGSSNDASVSADGRYVAYESTATNLVANQASGAITSNVFLFDRLNQATTLVSHDAANPAAGGNADSFSAVLSSNGHFLYYLSRATDLAGDTGPATENLYVYDTTRGTTQLVTASSAAPGQRADGDTGLIDPTRATGAPFAVSADGTRVAYVSTADDLVAGLTGSVGSGHPNVFLATVGGGITTQLVSHQAGSGTAGAGGWSPALSADGSSVAFVSDGTDLVANQAEQTPPGVAAPSAVFLYGVGPPASLVLVSRKYGTQATVAGGASDTPVIDVDGGVVAFRSDAADLVAQQFAGSPPGNVVVYERAADTLGLVSHAPGELTVGLGGTPFTPDSQGALPLSISADGASIAYQSQAAGLVGAAPQPGSPPSNVFLWQLSAVSPSFGVDGTNSLVSGAGGSPFIPANGSSFAPALSADGSTVAFVSAATNLVPGQATTGSARNVFTASTAVVTSGVGSPPTLVSAADGSTRVAANADSAGGALSQAGSPNLYPASIGLSADGGVLTFQSTATNLSTAVYKANNGTDVFAYDSRAGLGLVSQAATRVVTAGGDSYVASVSADDRYTAFVSDAFDLVPGQQNNHFGLNVFLRFDATDTAATITLVNHVPRPGSPTATGDSGIPRPAFTPDPGSGRLVPPPPDRSLMPVVSGDGSAVVFVTNDHDLVTGQQSPGSFNNVFRYSVADGSVTLVSHLPNNLTASGAYDSNSPAVSFKGEFVAFVSDGGVYLYDASAPQALTLIAASGSSPSMSDDGRYVAYVSQGNAFLYDRLAGTTGTSTLISHDASSVRGTLLALTAPTTVTAGTAFAVTATVQDANGTTDTTFNGTVTVALAPVGPAGATLGGTLTAMAVGGVAHFTDLTLTRAGAGYALTASANGVTPALTATFRVLPATASQLAFLLPPSLSLVRQPLAPTVAVSVEDAFGNAVDRSASVTVQLGSNVTGANLTGTTTLTAVNGVATFGGLAIDRAGTYTLTAGLAGTTATVTSAPFAVTTVPAGNVIATVAGTGAEGYHGDNGPATAALLNMPVGIARDAAGNLYIADTDNNVVRKVSVDGTILTVAGTGTAGYSGDLGPATAAQLFAPLGVAVDGSGNLYIADGDNNVVRKVSPGGTITTVAGDGVFGYGGDHGPATDAALAIPAGLALDAAGDLFIADANNRVIREVSPAGIITTVAGNGQEGSTGDGGPATDAELNDPTGVAVDAAGDLLYIADSKNNVIRLVSAAGIITTVAGDGIPGFRGDNGPATAAELSDPRGVAVDAAGNLYIADTTNGSIRQVSAGILTTVAGDGELGYVADDIPATAAELNLPMAVAVDAAGNLYVADNSNDRIREVSPAATKLVLLTPPPATLSAGDSFPVVVAVQDAGGHTVSGYSGPVHLTLGPGSFVGPVTGTTTVTAVNGVATFNLSLTRATGGANGYSLFFRAGGVVGVGSDYVVVEPQEASALVFAQQPSNAPVGGAINPPVVVQLVDPYGNAIPFSQASVTLGLGTGPAGATLGGTLTEAAPAGAATFADLTLDRPGTYTLTATSGTLTAVTSAPFSVGPAVAVVTITTVAGNGPVRYAGDGGPATGALFDTPLGVAAAGGNVFIADTHNNVIRKVSPSGIITTVAGDGSADYTGDGGPATAAALNRPTGVAVDAAGNLYIADSGNDLVREVSVDGTITTVAGSAGAEPGHSGDNGPATAATLNTPTGVAVDPAGNLYIADSDNNVIRKVSPSGIITTVAGSGRVGYGGDGGPATAAALDILYDVANLAVDAAGNLYLADVSNSAVRKVTPSGTISTVAGNGNAGDSGDGGPATAAELFTPQGVAVDTTGDLYIADTANGRVRKVSSAGTITTVAGDGTPGFSGDGGPASAAELDQPAALALAGGTLYLADSGNNRIRAVSPAGTITTLAGAVPLGDGGPATAAELNGPSAEAVDAAGNLYIADGSDNRIRKVTPAGVITTVAGNGDPGYSGDGGPATAARLRQPSGVFVDTGGNLYIADTGNQRLRKVTPSGTISTLAGDGGQGYGGDGGAATAASLDNPVGVFADTAGDVFVADHGNSRIRRVTPNGTISTVAGNGLFGFNGDGIPATDAALNEPSAVVADAAGNLFIADEGSSRIREVLATTGLITTVAGNGTADFRGDGGPATDAALANPSGVAVDPAGNLYIADTGNDRIRKVSPSGVMTTAAGNGTATDQSGDGGPALLSGFDLPRGLAADAQGNLYVADTGNDRVRKIVSPASRLAFTTEPPARVAPGAPFTVAVTVEDGAGNPVAGYTGTVTVALGAGSPAGATLGGTRTASIDPDNGVATFPDLSIGQSGSGYTLTATVGGLTAATTTAFQVGGVSAALLAVMLPSSPITAGVPFTVTVAAQDAFGNTDPTYAGQVTLTLPGGTVNATPSAGVATFSNLIIAQPGKHVTLSATAPGLSGVTTAPFNVGAATATQLVVSQPAGVKAGVPFAFTVTAEDNAGNVATNFVGQVTVGLGQNPTGAGLGGGTTVNAVNGVARFTLSVTRAGSGYTLTAGSTGLPTVATGPFNVAATPELLAITPPAAATAGSPFTVTVSAQDANGNLDPSFSGTITLAVGPGSPPGTFLGGPTSAAAVNGTATFSGLQLTQAGSYTLTATTANLLGGFSAPFLVNAGPAARLALTPPPTATAGSPFTVTVAVQDAQGNTVPSFNGPVTIGLGTNPTGATLAGTTTVSAAGGVVTFRLTLDRAGSGYTLGASAGGALAVTSLPFAVGGVTAAQLGVAGPAFVVAGVPFTVTVTAQDAGGNPVPSFNGPVTLALGPSSPAGATLGGTLMAQAVNGVATFAGLTLVTPGTGYTLASAAGTLAGTAPHPLAVLAGGDAPSSDPVISPQGNAVAYVSAADNLVPGQTPSDLTNVFLYTVATAASALVSAVPGSTTMGGDNNSDSPAINLDGSFVAYRSDARNLLLQQDGARGNVFLYGGGSTALVSAVSGSPHTGAGASFAPAIDGDGSKVVYLSSADDLVPNEAAGQTVNAYLYAAPLAESFLVTGQLGSATVPGNGDASNALISRHSFPLLSSAATNLVHGAGAHSNGYRNTLLTTSLALQGGTLLSGTGAGALVGTFSTASAFAGQFRPPTYSLTAGFGDNASFAASGNSLLTAALIDGRAHPSYTIQVRTDVGLGPIIGLDTLTLPVSPGGGGTGGGTGGGGGGAGSGGGGTGGGGVTARLVTVKVGKKKKTTRKMLEVFDASGALKEAFPAPFQGSAYRNVQVQVRGNQVIVTARKGRKTVTRTFTA
jgi:Tol biopolymer transport system component